MEGSIFSINVDCSISNRLWKMLDEWQEEVDKLHWSDYRLDEMIEKAINEEAQNERI